MCKMGASNYWEFLGFTLWTVSGSQEWTPCGLWCQGGADFLVSALGVPALCAQLLSSKAARDASNPGVCGLLGPG